MATSQAPGFFDILSESNKIVKAHSCHFLGLSFLFLFPLSISLLALHHSIIGIASNTIDSEILLILSGQQRFDVKSLAPSLIFALTALTLSICATSTISYSVFHGFYGRPLKFASAFKSLLNSFLRLFVTILSANIIIFGNTVLVNLIALIALGGIGYLGFDVSLFSTSFNVVYSIGLVILLLGLVYLHVNWALASVIVVIESRWGLQPLRQSWYLVRGMRRVALSLLLLFGLVTGFEVWSALQTLEVLSGMWSSWKAVVHVVSVSVLVMLILLYSVVAHTVLYIYSKALNGEIVEEFGREYVSLPFDEEKVQVPLPHVVYVVEN